MEDTTVLSPKPCDLQDPLGQQCVPVGERWTQLNTSKASGSIGQRDTGHHRHSPAPRPCPNVTVTITDTHQDSQRWTQPTIPTLTKIIHSPSHRYTHEHQIWAQQATGMLSLNTGAETHPGGQGQLCFKAQTWAHHSVLPPALPHTAHLSLSVSMGTLFFSHVIRGLGRPWIWHWKRATPPSSPTVAWGCTWKSDMAGERKGVMCGRGTLLRCRGEPLSSPLQGAGISLDLADTGHQLGDTFAFTLPPTMGNISP